MSRGRCSLAEAGRGRRRSDGGRARDFGDRRRYWRREIEGKVGPLSASRLEVRAGLPSIYLMKEADETFIQRPERPVDSASYETKEDLITVAEAD